VYYAPALRTFPSVAVVSVADPAPASRTAASRAFPAATIHGDYQDLLDRPVDALLVVSPPSTHLDVLNAALSHRVPVFIEKPFLLCDDEL